MWNFVISHFDRFLKEIELRPEDRQDAEGKAERIAKSLAARYYPNQQFNPLWYLKVGSYGKGTGARPRSDLDMLFILPDEVCSRIQALQGNRQSQLLQEVKNAVKWTFSTTDLGADGQIVSVPFTTYLVEVVPAFSLGDGTFLMPHTAAGGSWRVTDPFGEARNVKFVDDMSIGKATHLNKMMKVWKRECSVPIKSIFLEMMVNAFVKDWRNRDQSLYYYDWMIRDFFAFMLRYVNGTAKIQATTEWIDLGDKWESKHVPHMSVH